MNPPATETTFAELIRGCVEQNGNDDWLAFRARTDALVHYVFLHYTQWGHLVDEFEDWFFGWLASGCRLLANLNAIRGRWQEPEHIPIEAREQYAWRYFRCIVQTGRAEFLEEVCSQLPLAPDVDPDNAPGHNPAQELAEQWEQVRAIACQLPQHYRIPFWLQLRAQLGPLLTEDAHYLRALHEHNTGWLDDQFLAFENGNAPAIAIAAVLGLNAACVYQRQTWARNWIREQLGPPA